MYSIFLSTSIKKYEHKYVSNLFDYRRTSSTGPKYEYHWADGQTVKKPIRCSAPRYIDYLMTWAQDQLDDETAFPSTIGR